MCTLLFALQPHLNNCPQPQQQQPQAQLPVAPVPADTVLSAIDQAHSGVAAALRTKVLVFQQLRHSVQTTALDRATQLAGMQDDGVYEFCCTAYDAAVQLAALGCYTVAHHWLCITNALVLM